MPNARTLSERASATEVRSGDVNELTARDDWLRVPGRRRAMVGVVTDRHVVRLGALASLPPLERRHGRAADVGPVEAHRAVRDKSIPFPGGLR